jgi:hypothetical protein
LAQRHRKTGLRARCDLSGKGRSGCPGQESFGVSSSLLPHEDWRDPREEARVHEGKADLEGMSHAGPVGVPQQLVAHVEGTLQRSDPTDITPGVRGDRSDEALVKGKSAQRVAGSLLAEERG